MRVFTTLTRFRSLRYLVLFGLVFGVLVQAQVSVSYAQPLLKTTTPKAASAMSPTPTGTPAHDTENHTDNNMHQHPSPTPTPPPPPQPWSPEWKCVLPLSLSSLGGLLYALYKKYGKIKTLTKDLKDLEKQLAKTLKQHHQTQHQTEAQRRETWLTHLPPSFHNTLEINIKLLYPLWQFLGYRDENLSVGETIHGEVEGRAIQGQADWVVREKGQARAVALVKPPHQPLEAAFLETACQLAQALNAAYGLVTNGEDILLLRCDEETTVEVLRCAVQRLSTCWETLAHHLQATPPEPSQG